MSAEETPSVVGAIASTLVRSDGGSPPPATAGEQAGVGPRYQLGRLLGEGGMGRVEQVVDRDLRREVAVKTLQPRFVRDPAMVEQFLWEARVTAHLDHPNIVPLHDLGRCEGGYFYTMKLVRGAPLSEAAKALPVAKKLKVLIQVCQATAFAHARGVLHRDLKPANVMVGEYGEVLVTDWGLALPLDTEAGRALAPLLPPSVVEQSAGTPAYMSPEQARGEPLDQRSDVFSLGAMLYELLSGAICYDGRGAAEVLEQAKAGRVVSLRSREQPWPPGLLAIVEQAMAHQRDDRYPSVAALAADLEAYLDGQSPQAEHASWPRRMARYYLSKDRRLARLRVVDVDFLVAAGFLVGLWLAGTLSGGLRSPWWAALAAGIATAAGPLRRWFGSRGED